ncbi:RteC domain-containing protein [Mucilaginibacter sp. RCC_168]|uniref:RteC domain-containing protein n=1 Tax=Mucilaginibacter sp. RCC_168 TaxID=3239221 RepID=UPI0035260294
MNQQIEKLRSKLTDDLFEINEIESPLEKLSKASKTLEVAIKDLNQFIEKHQFSDEEEEITFFKIIKPEFIALRIEEVMRYNLIVNKPIGTAEIQLKYYEDELKALQSFFRMNSFHYQYYRTGVNDLDRLYFLRGAQPLSVPLAEMPDGDYAYLTPMSFLFAKFISYEHIQYFILEQITPLKYPELNLSSRNGNQVVEMKWTGDSINIVELAYGIWLTGQLNNGNASLNQIVRWLEANLHVTIGIVQRRFIEIERRKRLSPTKYVDQMRNAIIQKIESGNAL